jgi:amino acid adenylation domain-containing protein
MGHSPEQIVSMMSGGSAKRESMSALGKAGFRGEARGLIQELFEGQVARAPGSVALSCGEETLSYSELNHRANRVAHYLQEHGVGPDVIVAIFLDRSVDLVVAILGVLKAGGAYLPIDLSYPKERVAFMLEDAKAAVLITHRELAAKLPAHQVHVVHVDDSRLTAVGGLPSTNPTSTASSSNLAYVIFTSGSTGQPKGALITHHNVVRLFDCTDAWYHFNERDVWTLFHSCAFDFSVWEIWGALLYGGRLVVVPYMVSRSPGAFYELISREKVTVLNQTPSAFRQLVQAEESAREAKPLALRYVIFGGEALEMRSLKPWYDRHGDQSPQLVNMYGITETTVHVTYRPLTKDDLQSGSVIGIPIPDLQVHILDAQLQPVSVGTAAEMFVGGAGLARGYLNRPELTAERFIPDPFSREAGARLYRTGDLARFLPNGDIEYLGRIDQQVKIRGFRIEIGEIESVLCEHGSVLGAAVLAREDAPGEKRLVAYVVARNGSQPVVSELRAYLKIKLPEYMVPSAFVFLEQFPLTNNGKLDRDALLELSGNNHPAAPPVLPASQIEAQILNIWREVLHGAPVGLNDNFFDLGGDSMLLAQVHVKLQKVVGREFPITDLFAHTTIRALAAHLGGGEPKATKMTALQERARRQRQILNPRGTVRS